MKVESDVEAGEEGLVEGSDAVRSEEDDATMILKVSEEYGDDCIALCIALCPLL